MVFNTPPAALPDTIGPYIIRRLLGEGGMGAVYLGEHCQTKRKAAIKVIRDGDTSKVIREAEVLGRINNDNVARLFEADLNANPSFIAIEYIEGLPITEHCDQNNLPVSARLKLFTKLCLAVDDIHAHDVIHRDIKPSNVLVTQDGRVKILDLGIAKFHDAERQDPARIPEGMSYAYASPEQKKNRPTDGRSDVYSLGILLFELLVGKLPSEVPTVSRKDQEDLRIPRLSQVAKPWRRARQLRGNIESIVQKALKRDPNERYSSARKLANDLAAHLEQKPIQAKAPSIAYRSVLSVQRNWVALVACVVLLAVAIHSRYQATEIREREEAATEVKAVLTDVLSAAAEGSFQPMTGKEILDIGAGRAGTIEFGSAARASVEFILGMLYSHLGEYELAEITLWNSLEGYEIASDDEPRIPRVKAYLAEAYERNGLFEEAGALAHDALNSAGLDEVHQARASLVLARVDASNDTQTYLDEAIRLVADTDDCGHRFRRTRTLWC